MPEKKRNVASRPKAPHRTGSGRVVFCSEFDPLSTFSFGDSREIHRVVTCLVTPGIMLLLGLCATLRLMPLASTRADPASNEAGGFTYEHSQRKNTFA